MQTFFFEELIQNLDKFSYEESFYSELASFLKEKLEIDAVWIGEVISSEKIVPRVSKGILLKKIQETDIVLRDLFDFPYSQSKINIQNIPEKIRFNFPSVACLLIHKEGIMTFVIVLYSKKENYFPNKQSFLEILQKELELRFELLRLFKERNLYIEILKNLDDLVIILDENGEILFANFKAERFLEMDKNLGNWLFKELKELTIHRNKRIFYKKGTMYSIFKFPIKSFYFSHEKVWIDFSCYNILLDDESLYIILGKDVSKEYFYKEELEKLRYYDELTGLLNYDGLVKKIKDLDVVFKKVETVMLVLIDIYNFVYINSIYGYSVGDKILKAIAKRLKKISDFVARVVSDTFAIFVVNIKKDEVFQVLDNIQNLLHKKIVIDKKEITLDYNIGIAISPEDGKDWETLWKNANIALFQAKEEGRGVIKFFNPQFTEKVSEFLEVQNIVKKALEKNFFVFYYQPYFDLKELKLVGIEALVRIKDEKLGLIYPDKFIEFLENSPHIYEFEAWGIEYILKKIEELKLSISFNVSAKSFSDPTKFNNLFQKIKNFFEQNFKACEFLTIEITERVLSEDLQKVRKFLYELKNFNVKIAIDDFGTGYSSLKYFKELPIDILKIDKSFTKEMIENEKDLILIRTIIELAKAFDVKVLAEGVENEKQLEILKKLNCDYVQGFLFSKPIPEEEIKEKFLKSLHPKCKM